MSFSTQFVLFAGRTLIDTTQNLVWLETLKRLRQLFAEGLSADLLSSHFIFVIVLALLGQLVEISLGWHRQDVPAFTVAIYPTQP